MTFSQIKTAINTHSKTAAVILGAASVLALPPYFIFPVLFITFSSLLLLLQTASGYKKAFALGYWFGFGFYACGLAWIGNALLVEAQTFGWLYPIAFLASGAFFGLFSAVPAWLSFYFKNIYAKYLSFAALWVILEWIRSFILTGFPWNLLGTTLAFTPSAIQSASVFGTYGLSLLVIMLTAAPALAIYRRNRQNLITALSVMAFLALANWGYGFWRLQHLNDNHFSNITVRVVQPAIPQSMKWSPTSLDDNIRQYITLSQKPGLQNIDFVIWGETASPFPLDYDEYYRQEVTQAIPAQGRLITGLVRYLPDENNRYQPLNSMFVINKDGMIEGSYDKSHLVPFGEYIPLRDWLPSWVRPITNTIANFKAGNGPENLQIASYPPFGTLICYEINFPAQVVNNFQKPEWLINLTNDGWYGDSAGPHQHLVATQMRAIEEGLTIVRAANTGISAVIDRSGRVTASLPLNQSGVLDTKLPKELSISTFYGKYHNIIPLILCFFNLALAFILKIRIR